MVAAWFISLGFDWCFKQCKHSRVGKVACKHVFYKYFHDFGKVPQRTQTSFAPEPLSQTLSRHLDCHLIHCTHFHFVYFQLSFCGKIFFHFSTWYCSSLAPYSRHLIHRTSSMVCQTDTIDLVFWVVNNIVLFAQEAMATTSLQSLASVQSSTRRTLSFKLFSSSLPTTKLTLITVSVTLCLLYL